MKFTYTTDTATLAIFDIGCLQHRIDDDADWWSDPFEELDEVNGGNLVLVGLETDGSYSVTVNENIDCSLDSVSAVLKNETGGVFVGPGEEIPAGGYAPFQRPYTFGQQIDLEPGVYRVTVSKRDAFDIIVGLQRVEAEPKNDFSEQLLLE